MASECPRRLRELKGQTIAAEGIERTRTSTTSALERDLELRLLGSERTTTRGVSLSKPARLASNKSGHLRAMELSNVCFVFLRVFQEIDSDFPHATDCRKKVKRTNKTTSVDVDKRQVPADLRG